MGDVAEGVVMGCMGLTVGISSLGVGCVSDAMGVSSLRVIVSVGCIDVSSLGVFGCGLYGCWRGCN